MLPVRAVLSSLFFSRFSNLRLYLSENTWRPDVTETDYKNGGDLNIVGATAPGGEHEDEDEITKAGDNMLMDICEEEDGGIPEGVAGVEQGGGQESDNSVENLEVWGEVDKGGYSLKYVLSTFLAT